MWQQTWKEDEEDDDVEKENQQGVFSSSLGQNLKPASFSTIIQMCLKN